MVTLRKNSDESLFIKLFFVEHDNVVEYNTIFVG